SPKADRHFGWHFNPAQAGAPASFARGDQFRKHYHREGLLQVLIDRGALEKVPAPPDLPRPRVRLWIEEDGVRLGPDDRERILVRHPRVTLRVPVAGRSLDTLKSVTWQMGDAPATPFALDEAADRELAAPLELKRGVDTVVRVTTWLPEAPAEP